jgi:hypothetical protein
LATANENAAPGDTIYLRGGIYDSPVLPVNSGKSGARISYRAYGREEVTIHNTSVMPGEYFYYGIALLGVSYITVDGINVDNPVGSIPEGKGRPLMITNGASYNEISNCDIDGNGDATIQWWRGDHGAAPVTHNWMHDCTIHHTGQLGASGSSVDDWGGMQIGVPDYDSESEHNTIENCVFYSGGHHNLETFTKYNVIRNCYFHHEGSMPNNTGLTPVYGPDSVPPAAEPNLWGNRNIQIYDGYNSDGVFNLLEGNRFGYAGPPPDDDGGDGLTITAPKNIIRYNYIFNSLNNGVLFKTGTDSYADNNRFYNNTIYKSGRYRNTGPQWQGYSFRWYGSYVRNGNVIINNIMNTYGGSVEMNTNSGSNRIENNWMTADGSPLFVNTDVSNPMSRINPDLRLRINSRCINRGIPLTATRAAGSNSVKLVVEDALFFQDGTWGSALTHGVTLFPDWIAIGTVDNVVQIKSIDYATNTITLMEPRNWSAQAPVWLYRNSSGEIVLYGSAPDIGASEYKGMPALIGIK